MKSYSEMTEDEITKEMRYIALRMEIALENDQVKPGQVAQALILMLRDAVERREREAVG